VPDAGAETPVPLKDALAAGMQEEVRDAQRERWRSEVRLQAALDQVRYFEGKAQGMEEQNGELRSHVAWLESELNAITTSRAWKTVLRIRGLQRAIPGRGR
jgi:hypothetical protein